MKFSNLKYCICFLMMTIFLSLTVGESVSHAQTLDFFSNSSTSNSRFKSAGHSNDCPTCPGFNPCNGSTLSGTSCNGNGLLRSTVVVGGVVTQVGTVGDKVCISLCGGDTKFRVMASPLFGTTGPGAVTDNMFGVVSDPTRTEAEVIAGFRSFGKGDRAPGKCGNSTANGDFDQTIDTGIHSGLNCGYLRYDPATQGMTLPGGSNTLGGQMIGAVNMAFTSQNTAPDDCILGDDIPRDPSTGANCDMVDFSADPRAFTAIEFNFNNPATLVAIPKGFFNEFTLSNGVVCNPVTLDRTCARQSLVQETQTENGTSHAEWAFVWSATNNPADGSPSSGAADCGGQATQGKVCVHWFSEYEDSPCKIVAGVDPDPSDCRGVASGFGFLDISEGFFVYNGEANLTSTPGSASYPLGPQASFGIIP